MKKLTTLAATTAFVLSSAGMSLAAGPTVVESEPAPEVDTTDPTPAPLLFGSLGAGGAAVAALGVAAVAAAASSGGSDGAASTTTTD